MIKTVKLILYCVWVLSVFSEGIYNPSEVTSKPAYTKKIWRSLALTQEEIQNTQQIIMHHNYSKVSVHGSGSSAAISGAPEDAKRNPKNIPFAREDDNQKRESFDDDFEVFDPQINEIESQERFNLKPYANMAFENCPRNSTGQLVYLWSCSQFLNCWKGRTQISNCPVGTLFSPETLECDYQHKVKCISGTHNQKVTSEKYISARTDNICDSNPGHTLVPHPDDCSKFIFCVFGKPVVQNCAPGTLFNKNLLTCDHPYKVNCEINTENEEGTTENPYTLTDDDLRMGPITQHKLENIRTEIQASNCQSCPTSGQQNNPQNNRPKCPLNHIGLLAHPYNCKQFLNCANGITHIQDCGPGTMFNSQTKVCDWPQNVQCEARSNFEQTQTSTPNYIGVIGHRRPHQHDIGPAGGYQPCSGSQCSSHNGPAIPQHGYNRPHDGTGSNYNPSNVGTTCYGSQCRPQTGPITPQVHNRPHDHIDRRYNPSNIAPACSGNQCRPQTGPITPQGSYNPELGQNRPHDHTGTSYYPSNVGTTCSGSQCRPQTPPGGQNRPHDHTVTSYYPSRPQTNPITPQGPYNPDSGQHRPHDHTGTRYYPSNVGTACSGSQCRPPTPQGSYNPEAGQNMPHDNTGTSSYPSNVGTTCSGSQCRPQTGPITPQGPYYDPNGIYISPGGSNVGTTCSGSQCRHQTGSTDQQQPNYNPNTDYRPPTGSGTINNPIFVRPTCSGGVCPPSNGPINPQGPYYDPSTHIGTTGSGNHEQRPYHDPTSNYRPQQTGSQDYLPHGTIPPCMTSQCPPKRDPTPPQDPYYTSGSSYRPQEPHAGGQFKPSNEGTQCFGDNCGPAPNQGNYYPSGQEHRPQQTGSGDYQPHGTIPPCMTSQCPPKRDPAPPQDPYYTSGSSYRPQEPHAGGQFKPSNEGTQCFGDNCGPAPNQGNYYPSGQEHRPQQTGSGDYQPHGTIPPCMTSQCPPKRDPAPPQDPYYSSGSSYRPQESNVGGPSEERQCFGHNCGSHVGTAPNQGSYYPSGQDRRSQTTPEPNHPGIKCLGEYCPPLTGPSQSQGPYYPSGQDYSPQSNQGTPVQPPGNVGPGSKQYTPGTTCVGDHCTDNRRSESQSCFGSHCVNENLDWTSQTNATTSSVVGRNDDSKIIYVRPSPKANSDPKQEMPIEVARPVKGTKHWAQNIPSTDTNADYDFEETTEPSVTQYNNKKIWKSRQECANYEFKCNNNDCIPLKFYCDGKEDCSSGEDELNCQSTLKRFTKYSNKRLYRHETEKWLNTNLNTCSNYCLNSKSFTCKGFNYRTGENTCLLCNSNIGLSGGLTDSHIYDYYELNDFTIDCSDLYKCSNQKCINHTQICDGNNDCSNREDEKKCEASKIGYEIKLAGSNKKNEGRVEIKVFGEIGYVCDDKFGLRNADVVCKELGFSRGALDVKPASFFAKEIGDNETYYLMDDVQCLGNENSIRNCEFAGWGIHNCMSQEIVGVVCKTEETSCPSDHWKCDTTNECLPLQFLCDGIPDCGDNSDEGSQHCAAPIELRLIGGTSRLAGRVEIRYHGVWGTICDDDFNDLTAKIVCKSLGYHGSAVVKKDGAFGPGTGPIWLDQLVCHGNESFLSECEFNNWGEHNCEHAEDVGVVCSHIDPSIYERRSKNKDVVILPQVSATIDEEFKGKCGHTGEDLFFEEDDQNSEIQFRVVQGSAAKKGQYPWQATIRIKGALKSTHWCGAVVISNKFVLTAAHCVVGFAKGSYIVRAGDYNIVEDEGSESEAYIEDFFVHEKFRQDGHMNNDIALIKLKGAGLKLSKHIQPICLPDKNTDYKSGMNCTISGFGSTETGKSSYSQILRAGWVKIQPPEVCKMSQIYGESITDGMICAGSLDEGVDTCDGDSGGPLACLDKGLFTLYGLTSWGQRCGHANKPGVYVKVAFYKNWIDKKIQENS